MPSFIRSFRREKKKSSCMTEAISFEANGCSGSCQCDLKRKIMSLFFFWRKSALVGIAWGLSSLILGYLFGGSPFPLSHFWHWSLLAQVQYILFFPFHAIALIFPEHTNISNIFVSHVYTLALIVTPLIIGMIICVSFDYVISKIIKKYQ